MTVRQEASIRLANNLNKVVRVALISYNKQSAFYRHCNPINKHVNRIVEHFFKGFYREVEVERKALKTSRKVGLQFKRPLALRTQPVNA